MADKGPGPPTLILKRCEAEIKRLEHSIIQQELQLMELDDQKERIKTNIEASKKALAEAEDNYNVTMEQYQEEVNDG
jgi:hypothetical protein